MPRSLVPSSEASRREPWPISRGHQAARKPLEKWAAWPIDAAAALFEDVGVAERAETLCPDCHLAVVVLPSSLYALIPQELHAEVLAQVEEAVGKSGKRLTLAGDGGEWVCPRCGRWSVVPVDDPRPAAAPPR